MLRLLLPLLLITNSAIVFQNDEPTTTPADTGLADTAPVYLALGDSLAFGAGATDPAISGYVPLVHAGMQQAGECPTSEHTDCENLQLLNLAENGATTETLLETQLPTAIAIIEERHNDDDPANDVVAVTVTIGGNDAFGALIRICSSSINAICVEQVREVIGQIERNLTHILQELRNAAGPDTTIAVMTYFNSLIDCDFRQAAPNADLVLEGDPDVSRGLNEVIRLAAERADAVVAETFGQIDADDLVGGVDCLHANDAGYIKIADAFLGALLGHKNQD